MQMTTCANCARPMNTATAGPAAFERCPECGGAWFEEHEFEAMIASRAQCAAQPAYRRDEDWIEGIGPARQVRKFLKIAAASAVVLALILGAAGYYLVWPLVSRGINSGALIKIGNEVVGQKGRPLAAPADITNWAQQTAKKAAEDTLRKAVGLPSGRSTGEDKVNSSESGNTEGSDSRKAEE